VYWLSEVVTQEMMWCRGSIRRVVESFFRRGCMNPVASVDAQVHCADIGVNANLELVDRFC